MPQATYFTELVTQEDVGHRISRRRNVAATQELNPLDILQGLQLLVCNCECESVQCNRNRQKLCLHGTALHAT